MRRLAFFVTVSLALVAAACGGSSNGTPTSPSASTDLNSVAGTWAGAVSDSSGGALGMSWNMGGMSTSMGMGSSNTMTWNLTQTGQSFTGTVSMSGYMGGRTMTVTGTMNGRTGTFTMTMPDGSMPMSGCTGTMSGTFDMDDRHVEMHGTYSGSTTCRGPFDHGQMTMTRK
jgi:hypothetical protein